MLLLMKKCSGLGMACRLEQYSPGNSRGIACNIVPGVQLHKVIQILVNWRADTFCVLDLTVESDTDSNELEDR